MDNLQKLMQQAVQNGSTGFFDELSEADRMAARLIAAVSNEIFRIRKKMGLTQDQFAKKLGVTQSMVSQWESGEYNFTIELMARIFQQLKTGVDIGFLDENQCNDPIFSYGNMSEQTGETMFFSEAA